MATSLAVNSLSDLRSQVDVKTPDDLARHFDGKPGGRPYAWNSSQWLEIPNQLWENLAEELLAQAGKSGSTSSERRARLKEFKELRTVMGMNVESAHLLVLSDGNVLDLHALMRGEEYIRPAKEFQRHMITASMGVNYQLKSSRRSRRQVMELIRERIGDEESFEFFMIFLAGCLYGSPRVKGILEIFNLRRNTGKTAFMKILAKVFGTYFTKMSSHLLTPGLQHHADLFLYRHRHSRILTIDETDQTTALNERLIKAITGRDTFQVPYKTTLEDDFLVEAKILLDSNNLVRPQFEDSTISDRTFIVAWGKPYSPEERIAAFEDTVDSQEEMDAFFSDLVDEYFPKWWNLVHFERKGRMELTHEMFLLNANSPKVFAQRVCHIGKNSYEQVGSRYTTMQVYGFFVRWLKNFQLHLIKALGMDLDDQGSPMTSHQLMAEMKIPTHTEFKAVLDHLLGQAVRMGQGMVWKNLVVHPALVEMVSKAGIDEVIPGMSRVLRGIDRVRSEVDNGRDQHSQWEMMGSVFNEVELKASDFIPNPTPEQEQFFNFRSAGHRMQLFFPEDDAKAAS